MVIVSVSQSPLKRSMLQVNQTAKNWRMIHVPLLQFSRHEFKHSGLTQFIASSINDIVCVTLPYFYEHHLGTPSPGSCMFTNNNNSIVACMYSREGSSNTVSFNGNNIIMCK